ncbi:hypothetical protein DBX26_04860 [Vibrio sp. dhg]|nr:hypothetical protein DBX26_04860 [Vibrio sp. dhg]
MSLSPLIVSLPTNVDEGLLTCCHALGCLNVYVLTSDLVCTGRKLCDTKDFALSTDLSSQR